MKSENNSIQHIQEFYNEFSKKQVVTGINLRHYYLFKKIVRAGLKKNNNVLEIGCGIGTLTGLLAKHLKKGKVVATDISPENIEVAKKRLDTIKNIDFLVSDSFDLSLWEKFDFIVLADVLEHIPAETHQKLFGNIVRCMHQNSTIFINIPHPKRIEFLKKYSPEKLQIVDQALCSKDLIRDAESNDLILFEYKSYPLFHEEVDYVQVIFKMNKDSNFRSLSKRTIILKKMIFRFFYLLTKFK